MAENRINKQEESRETLTTIGIKCQSPHAEHIRGGLLSEAVSLHEALQRKSRERRSSVVWRAADAGANQGTRTHE